jgi:hypothetical protein
MTGEWTITWAKDLGLGIYRLELERGSEYAFATVGLLWARDAGQCVLEGLGVLRCADREAEAWLLADVEERADEIQDAAERRRAS